MKNTYDKKRILQNTKKNKNVFKRRLLIGFVSIFVFSSGTIGYRYHKTYNLFENLKFEIRNVLYDDSDLYIDSKNLVNSSKILTFSQKLALKTTYEKLRIDYRTLAETHESMLDRKILSENTNIAVHEITCWNNNILQNIYKPNFVVLKDFDNIDKWVNKINDQIEKERANQLKILSITKYYINYLFRLFYKDEVTTTMKYGNHISSCDLKKINKY